MAGGKGNEMRKWSSLCHGRKNCHSDKNTQSARPHSNRKSLRRGRDMEALIRDLLLDKTMTSIFIPYDKLSQPQWNIIGFEYFGSRTKTKQ
jgi:hypothetical protein